MSTSSYGNCASPAVAAPVTVSIGTKEIDIPPAAIAGSLRMESDDSGRVTARVDDTRLRQALTEQLKTVETAPKDATIRLSGGQPVITPHADGQSVEAAGLARNLLAVLRQAAPRRVTATLAPSTPSFTTEAANALGVTEKLSSFAANFVAWGRHPG